MFIFLFHKYNVYNITLPSILSIIFTDALYFLNCNMYVCVRYTVM